MINPVDFDALDRFALDGQRLIVKNGTFLTYGASGTVYETEDFSNLKVTSYGVHPSGTNYGPAYFIVEYPDGSKAYYGNSSDSLSVTDWSITYWENPQGVRISYNYTLSNNILYISSIKYGSINSTIAKNEIQFDYGARSFKEDGYVGGVNIIRDKNLTSIKVIGNGVGYRNYSLSAPSELVSITEKSGDNAKSYNPTVFNYGLNNSSTVDYLPLNTSIDVGNINSLNAATISGDFNNDGNTDFLLYPTTGPQAKKMFWLYYDIQSGSNQNIGYPLEVGNFDDIFSTTSLSRNNKVISQGWTVVQTDPVTKSTKFRGFSQCDTSIICPQDLKEYAFPKFTRQYFYPCDGVDPLKKAINKAEESSLSATPLKEGFVEKDVPKNYISGDFNGDGLTDIIAIESSVSYYINKDCATTTQQNYAGGKSYFINLDRRISTNFVNQSGFLSITNNSKYFVGDFNGDGKSDLYVFDLYYLKVYSLDDNNNLLLIYQNTTADPAIVLDKPILIGDYNGDGKSDFMIPKAFNTSDWYKYTSTGISQIKQEKTSSIVFSSNDSYNTYNFIPANFNNDGKTDLIRITSFRNPANTTGIITVACFSNEDGNFNSSGIWANTGDQESINIYALPMYLPQIKFSSNNILNQSQPTLEIAFVNKNKMYFFKSKYDIKENNLLNKITAGNGVQDLISYAPLHFKYKNLYYPIFIPSTGISNYPNMDITIDPNLYLVSKTEKKSKDVYKKRLFSYYGAVSNFEGLGFLGFRSVSQTNWYEDESKMITNVLKFDIDQRGANTENYSVLGFYAPLYASANPISRIITKGEGYTVTDSDNLVATQRITLQPGVFIKSGSTFSAKINPEANNSSNTPIDYITKSILTYESDLLANKVFKLQNIAIDQYNTLDGTGTQTINTYDAYNNVTNSRTSSKEGSTVVQTAITEISYQAPSASPYILGRPTSKTQTLSVPGNLMRNQEVYTYDGNQLLSDIDKSASGTATIKEHNDYDSYGNITKKTITAPAPLEPRITDYEYDPSKRFLTKLIDSDRIATTFFYYPDGTLKSETSPFASISYTYDSWFKKITVKDDKLNKTTTISYTKDVEKTVVTTITDVLDGSASEETFDDLGRKIKSGVKDINGSFSYVSYLYDIYNRNYKTSEPYFGTSPSQWNEIKYDVYGRNTQSTLFNGRTTSASYSGLTTTLVDGQKNKIATNNANGTIKSVNETIGGNINYSYFANGSLKQTNYNGVNITIEQDGWGRKTKLIDPSAGTFKYDNNDFGELTSETSQNGNVITTIKRDSKGKIIQKTIEGSGTNSITDYTYDSNNLPLTINYVDKNEPSESNRTLITIAYDDTYKRVTSITEEKFNVTKFTKVFSYDVLGRIDTETKTAEKGGKLSKVETKNVYKNGDLYQILDNTNNKVLWQTNILNAKGQVKESMIGNGIKMTNEYDSNGYLSKITHDKTTNPTANIITLTTVFDKNTDNLSSRTNSAFGNYTETFKYDEINRLKEFTNKLGVQETQNYDPSGKITSNNLGVYGYDTTKPYQNNAITLTPEATGYYTNREGIFNDSMENRTGWSLGAYNPQCISFDDTKSHTGKNALKINTVSAGVTTSYVQSDVSVAINNKIDTEYTFSGWVYTDNPTAQLTLFTYKEGETGYTNVTSVNTNVKNSWVYITQSFMVPFTIKNLRLRLDAVGSGNVWFDDVEIRKTSNAATAERKLIVTYNAFKSPIQIDETGVDKISFTYNDNNQRSTMYYGGLEDKLLRPLRKHYSADGTMEIKENIVTGTVEFVTYIGGDGYSAPIISKSDGANAASYLYLHRDYQGTILAITNSDGAVVEKRLFDAWGSIIKVLDGAGNALAGLTVLDRGYTGHEHLQSIGLVNMNARLYDPMLHRFLQVDNYIQNPSNTQNYNQYGYVLNNPLMYTDPSGNKAQGNGKDCVDCGLSNSDQTFIGSAISTVVTNWDEWGIKDWAKKNLNFNSWGKSWNKFWGKNRGSDNPRPQPNMSSYINLNSTNFTGAQMANTNFNLIYDIKQNQTIIGDNLEKIPGKTNEVGTSVAILTSGLEIGGMASPYMKGFGSYAGNIATFAQAVDNTVKVRKDEKEGGISRQRYSYKMIGTATSWGVTYAIGQWGIGGAYAGPYGVFAGVFIGAGFQGIEYAYDIVAPQIQSSYNGFVNNLYRASYNAQFSGR
ncbi:RHS repeat-associated core domain-containing protein [Flavobacterium aquidurense]|uniref:RHS repeat-associated core domain-containing protein n=1 Tax=Flavobacterium aquidurense TaxID=362413 RepID=UPI001FD73580|nr:RHS repeat-associated core domain-containing protein [Flavobacterium aquidurense]